MNMTDRIAMHAATKSTVHCWSPSTPNKTFKSLRAAIEYVREHREDLPAIEVFVHAGDLEAQIISGDELTSLVERVCTTAEAA